MHFDFVCPVMWDSYNAAFYSGLGEHLIKRGYKVGFITTSRIGDRKFASKGMNYFNIHDIVKEAGGPFNVTGKMRESLVKKYDLHSLEDFYFPEMAYHGGSEEKLLLKTLQFFKAMEYFLDNNGVKCFVQNIGAEILRRVIHCIAKNRSIQNVYAFGGPFPGKTAFVRNEMGRWEDLKLRPYDSLTASQRKQAEEYIHSCTTNKTVLSTLADPGGLVPRSLAKPFQIWHRKHIINQGQEPESWTRHYKMRVLKPIRGQLAKIYYTEFDPGERYIFFPLHAPDDSQITIRAPQFFHQEFVVEMLARFLPEGYKLYVKPHPAANGYYPLAMLRSIAKIKNVSLLHPGINSHDVIRNASVVVVINSTVGFESLLYCKPVIVLGEVFYRGYGLTVDVENLFDLKAAIKRALGMSVAVKEVRAFVASAMAACPQGVFKITTADNFEVVAEGIIQKAIEGGFGKNTKTDRLG